MKGNIDLAVFGTQIFGFLVPGPLHGGGDMLILDRGYSLAKLPRFFEGAEKSPRREVVRSSAGAGVIYPPFLGSFA